MVHRGIATLSGAMMLCFLILSGLDTQFFFLHFYESLIYLVIILMLFYFADHWAYMLGIMAPTVWILQQLVMGFLWNVLRSTASYVTGGERPTGTDVITVLTAILAVMMIIFCVRHWRREFSGLGKFWPTFVGSLVVIIIYYGILWYWFGSLFPWK